MISPRLRFFMSLRVKKVEKVGSQWKSFWNFAHEEMNKTLSKILSKYLKSLWWGKCLTNRAIEPRKRIEYKKSQEGLASPFFVWSCWEISEIRFIFKNFLLKTLLCSSSLLSKFSMKFRHECHRTLWEESFL